MHFNQALLVSGCGILGVAYGGVYGHVGIVSLRMQLSLLERVTIYSFGMTVELGISL